MWTEIKKYMQANNRTLLSSPMILFVSAAFFAFWLVLWAIPYAPGVSPDSVVYIDGARNILNGNGFQLSSGEVITRYPPGYPALLALVTYINHDVLQATRWLHAFLFAVNVMLIGLATYLAANKRYLPTLFSVLLYISSVKVLDIHIMAWSEPLFIALTLSTFILFARYIVRPCFHLLLAVGVGLSLALMTRYVGVTLLPPMIFIVLAFRSGSSIVRIRDCLILSFVGVFPLAMWMLRNLLASGAPAGRSMIFHPAGLMHIEHLMFNMRNAWLPIGIGMKGWMTGLLLLIAFCFVVGALFFNFKNYYEKKRPADYPLIIPILSLLFSFTYVLFIFASISLMDASTSFDYRILSPLHGLSIVIVVSLCWRSYQIRRGGFYFRCCCAIIFFVVVCINSHYTVSAVAKWREDGRGYANRTIMNSESIAYAKSVPNDVIVYSNAPDLIRFWTQSEARMIAIKFDNRTLLRNLGFNKELNMICKDVLKNKAIILYINYIDRPYLPTKEELETMCDFPKCSILSDGIVFSGNKIISEDEQDTAPEDISDIRY